MLKTNLFSSNSAELSGFLPEGHSYGFNGKELDSEGMGGGSSTYDYGFRIYNPALAKFLSVDPLFKSFPFYTPYHFAGNMPIAAIDLDGLEIYFAANGSYAGKWGTSTEVKVINDNDVCGFQDDLASAKNDPGDWVKQDIMNFYWSGAAGSRTPNTADMEAISKDHVIPTETCTFIQDADDCFDAATGTLENNGYVVGSYFGEGENYQMYTTKKSQLSKLSETQLRGFNKINEELDANRPVLVGINYHDGSNNPKTDQTTEHFIVLTSREFDENGNLYYSGFENVASEDINRATSKELNRFYPQEDGTLQGGTCFIESGMTITQVRPVHSAKSENE